MTAGVVICEATDRWATALRRALRLVNPTDTQRLVETRLLEDCAAALDRFPGAIVAVEISRRNAGAVVEWLVRVEAHRPATVKVVLASEALRDHEAWLREAGAVDFITSPRAVRRVAEMARHWGGAAADGRPSPTQFADHILATLPWGDAP